MLRPLDLNASVEMLQRSVNSVSATMEKWSQMMQESANASRNFTMEGARPKKPKNKGNETGVLIATHNLPETEIRNSTSETTIYENTVQPEQGEVKRNSTSSEDAMDTSDEFPDTGEQINKVLNTFAEKQRRQQEMEGGRGREPNRAEYRYYEDPPVAGSSRQPPLTDEEVAQNRADDMIRQAEAGKAKILGVSGRTNTHINEGEQRGVSHLNLNDHHPALIGDYLVVGNHID